MYSLAKPLAKRTDIDVRFRNHFFLCLSLMSSLSVPFQVEEDDDMDNFEGDDEDEANKQLKQKKALR